MIMIRQLRDFFILQRRFTVLSVVFAGYLGVVVLSNFTNGLFFEAVRFIGGLLFMFLGTGISIVLILQWLSKRDFDQWEFASFALLGVILISPSILITEFALLHQVYSWYPIANSVVLWCGAGALLFFKKTSLPSFHISKESLKHPVSVALLFGFLLTILQIISYPTLPDLDPYKWLVKYTYQFTNQQLDYAERPLFGSFVFMATRFLGIGVFSFFKYLFPFLFLSTIFPAWMVARIFQDRRKQWLFILFIFSSPVLLLYAITAMPQTALIILVFFFIFFLLYADEKKDDLFLYSGGLIAFLSFFYHQSGIIIFIPWLLVVVIKKWRLLFSDKKTTFLIACLIATNFSFFGKMCEFSAAWARVVISFIFKPNNVNLLYPAYYTNIDRTVMGWGSITGVLKFYAFHMGPLIGMLLIYFVIMLLSNLEFRRFFINKIKKQTGALIGCAVFLVFFSIAEIFPRFPAIALLPDRAWLFNGPLSFVLLFIILRFTKFVSLRSLIAFFLFFIVCVSGASYINYQKRFLITPAQWDSAGWIKKSLPENRFFLSYGHKSLLPVHANTSLIRIPSEVYCSKDIQEFQGALDNIDSESMKKSFVANFKPFLDGIQKTSSIAASFNASSLGSESKEYPSAIETVKSLKEKVDALEKASRIMEITFIPKISRVPVVNYPVSIEDVYRQKLSSTELDLKNNYLFVYYARQHEMNPYRGRPYEIQTWGIDPCSDGKFLFDLYPDNFKRVYEAGDEEVIIWQVLKK